jgi:hypothetical protein
MREKKMSKRVKRYTEESLIEELYKTYHELVEMQIKEQIKGRNTKVHMEFMCDCLPNGWIEDDFVHLVMSRDGFEVVNVDHKRGTVTLCLSQYDMWEIKEGKHFYQD